MPGEGPGGPSLPPGGRQAPHLSGRCHPASLQGSDSDLAARRSLHSGTVAGISLSRGGPVTNGGRSPGRHGGQPGKGGPTQQGGRRLRWKQQELRSGLRGPGDSRGPLTCSAGPGEPAGPLPARAAGVVGPGGSRPRTAAVGGPVDGPAWGVGTPSQWQHGGLPGSPPAFPLWALGPWTLRLPPASSAQTTASESGTPGSFPSRWGRGRPPTGPSSASLPVKGSGSRAPPLAGPHPHCPCLLSQWGGDVPQTSHRKGLENPTDHRQRDLFKPHFHS